jgi:ribosomal protein L7Ae-like RNA K-turn-binding protein
MGVAAMGLPEGRRGPPQVAGWLGLAQRAGKVCSGDVATRLAVQSGRARAVVVASDAGSSTARRFVELCRQTNCPLLRWGDKVALGRALGRPPRSVAAVTDAALAGGLARLVGHTTVRGEARGYSR